MAPMSPVPAARSVSSRMRSFSPAVNVRRLGRSDNSGLAAAGSGTTVGPRASSVPAPAAAFVSATLLGMTTRQFSYALKSKLPGRLCLIIIGTEGQLGVLDAEAARFEVREHRLDAPASRILKSSQIAGFLRHGDNPGLGVARVMDDADVGARPPSGEFDIFEIVNPVLGALPGRRLARGIKHGKVALEPQPIPRPWHQPIRSAVP